MLFHARSTKWFLVIVTSCAMLVGQVALAAPGGGRGGGGGGRGGGGGHGGGGGGHSGFSRGGGGGFSRGGGGGGGGQSFNRGSAPSRNFSGGNPSARSFSGGNRGGAPAAPRSFPGPSNAGTQPRQFNTAPRSFSGGNAPAARNFAPSNAQRSNAAGSGRNFAGPSTNNFSPRTGAAPNFARGNNAPRSGGAPRAINPNQGSTPSFVQRHASNFAQRGPQNSPRAGNTLPGGGSFPRSSTGANANWNRNRTDVARLNNANRAQTAPFVARYGYRGLDGNRNVNPGNFPRDGQRGGNWNNNWNNNNWNRNANWNNNNWNRNNWNRNYGWNGYGYNPGSFWPLIGFNNYPFYGYGWRAPYWSYGYRYGGWGNPYYGWGYRYPYYAAPFWGIAQLGLLGLGWGYGGYGYGYNNYGGYGTTYVYPTQSYTVASVPVEEQVAAQPAVAPEATEDFAAQGEIAFKQGDYEAALRAWRHALVDDPSNGTLVLLMAQALFATGKFDEAAGATQQAMTMLADKDWGLVVTNYKDLYARPGDYSTQLKALETAIRAKPDDPALRFLAGYHYGYLGYPKDAVVQLNRVIELVPQDEGAKKLRDLFSGNTQPNQAPQPTETVPMNLD